MGSKSRPSLPGQSLDAATTGGVGPSGPCLHPTMNLWTNPLVARQLRLNRETLDFWRLYRSHREAVADLICANAAAGLGQPLHPGRRQLQRPGPGPVHQPLRTSSIWWTSTARPWTSRRPTAVSPRPRQNQPAWGNRPHRHLEDSGHLGASPAQERKHRPLHPRGPGLCRPSRPGPVRRGGIDVPVIPDHRFGRLDDRTRGRAPGTGAGSAAAASAPAGGTASAGRDRHSGHRLLPGSGRRPPTAGTFAAAGKRPGLPRRRLPGDEPRGALRIDEQ